MKTILVILLLSISCICFADQTPLATIQSSHITGLKNKLHILEEEIKALPKLDYKDQRASLIHLEKVREWVQTCIEYFGLTISDPRKKEDAINTFKRVLETEESNYYKYVIRK